MRDNRFHPIPPLTVTEHVIHVVGSILNNFAAEKGYDSIVSACSYYTSTVPRFKAEADRAIVVRDTLWTAVFAALEDTSKTAAEILDSLESPTWE